ncbi:MAG: prepilin-type N-terminal cleavage/methylation domain-containing protein [Gammaproteobacteria bacterium]|nr:prepilin-type N-terminal cleavage/methylation domain-containing protein [Gammaproteobacteria bacterium]
MTAPAARVQNRTAGFTLIEVMVVVAIIAILAGAVVINLNIRNPAITVRDSALRTALLMELAADQAVYSRQQLGVRFHPNSYEFYVLSADDEGERSWEILPDERLFFKEVDIPIEFEVDISGLPIVLETLVEELESVTDEEPIKPHVMFLSNGEIMPDFRIRLSDVDNEFRHEISTGEIEPIVVEQIN